MWGSLTDDEREDAVHVHTAVCHNHLRSTMLRHGIKEELRFLKEVLAEAMEELTAHKKPTGLPRTRSRRRWARCAR